MNSEIHNILPKSIITINYYECNIDSIWISIIIIIIMIFFLIFLKIILYSHIYKINRVCHPIPFFFGEPNSCKHILYSVKAQHLKQISEAKTLEIIKARDEEKAIEKEKKRIKDIQKQKENESCDSIGEDFSNQYKTPHLQEGLQVQYIPVYILAMYNQINLNIVNVIEKMKTILYIIFNEYVYPKIYCLSR